MQMLMRKGTFIVIDIIIVNFSLIFAFLLRFDGNVPAQYIRLIEYLMLLQTLIFIASFRFFNLYSILWRFASLGEMLNICKAVLLGVAVLGCIFFIHRSIGFPRSILIMIGVLNIMLVGASRILIRILREQRMQQEAKKSFLFKKKANVLIVGAGATGAAVLQEIRKHAELNYNPIGFIDDNPNKRKLRIGGVPVLGNRHDIQRIVQEYDVDEIITAIVPSACRTEFKAIVEICKASGVKTSIFPGVHEIINGNVSLREIREVDIEDLLGRKAINLNIEEIAEYLTGQTVLVTGAGGSIGSELCRQIVKFAPAKLVMLDNNENNLYDIELELRGQGLSIEINPVIANIQDREKINHVFRAYKPEVVFHAAAHKHVPMMEINPEEAIKNNVFGTKNVCEAAVKHKCSKFVLISTDKAVNPTSVMGASKRLAEMLIQHFNSTTDTKFMAVRFGNVLGSKGSVVPIFKKQIAKGGPVTVTDPEMVRFFMTIPEASQLVIQAGAMGKGGEIFVLDMGEPVKILDLARDLIRLSGFIPDEDIKIEFTGIRPGEKLYEEILTAEEGTSSTKHDRIFLAKLNEFDPDKFFNRLEEMAISVAKSDSENIIKHLKGLIDTYRPNRLQIEKSSKREDGKIEKVS